jgi:hypothetical protein
MSSSAKFEGEIEDDGSSWDSIKNTLTGTDKTTKAGIALGTYWAAVKPGPLPNSEEIVEGLPQKVEIGDNTYNPKDLAEDADRFFDESVWGLERNADNWLEELTLRTDKLGHYTVSYLGAKALCKGVDKASSELDIFSDEYDPKKIAAAGLATAPMYFALKEGYIEGPGFDFNLSSMDQQADLMYDTAGAIHATYNYHKERTAQGDEEFNGLIGDAMHGLGRTYGKASKFGKKYLNPSEYIGTSEKPTEAQNEDVDEIEQVAEEIRDSLDPEEYE